jgi:hypothetical protein
MQHRTYDELQRLADVRAAHQTLFTRQQRLSRWAELLQRDPGRRLQSLGEIEFRTEQERKEMRANQSPLTVAYEDPLLREAGLASDRLGDGMEFFELSEPQAHRLLCSCMNGATMTAAKVTAGVKHLADPYPHLRTVLWLGGGAAILIPLLFLLG